MKAVPVKHAAAAHADGVWAAAWTADGLLLTGSVDESVRTWKGDDLELTSTSSGHVLGVVGLAVDPTGSTAAASSLDSTVRVFDIASNTTKASLDCQPAEAWSLSYHPQGSLLAIAGGASGAVKLYSTETWKLEGTLQVPKGEGEGEGTKSTGGKFVLAVAWSPDGKRIACSTMDGTVAVFDPVKRKFLHTLEGHFMPVRSLSFSTTDPRILFTASDDTHVHMYDAEGKTLVAGLSGHAGWVLSVACSSDGSTIATGSSDRTVRLWDIGTRTSLQTLKEHTDQVWAAAFAPSGGRGPSATRLASVSDDKSICLYDCT